MAKKRKVQKGCYRNGKFFLKREAYLLDKVEPKELRDHLIAIWPQNTSGITDIELKNIILNKLTFDPKFIIFLESLLRLRLWCTECDHNLLKNGVAMDCPTDGIFYSCPECNKRIVVFIDKKST